MMRTPVVMRPSRRKTPPEVEEEMQFHIEMLECKYAKQGMSIADSKAAALRRFGNLETFKQQCVDISSRNSLLRRVLKIASIVLALTGLSIRILSSDVKIAHIGDTLIMIAVSGRLLLYVRGMSPSACEAGVSIKPGASSRIRSQKQARARETGDSVKFTGLRLLSQAKKHHSIR